MQALYLHALDPIAETTADPNSYGFRKERSCADAMEQCAIVLSNSTRPQWILEGDIKSCFDKISHDWLLTHIPGIRLRRDSLVSVMYAEEPNSTTSSVTLQRTDRHEILGQKPSGFQESV